jgi:hypothetical protein
VKRNIDVRRESSLQEHIASTFKAAYRRKRKQAWKQSWKRENLSVKNKTL